MQPGSWLHAGGCQMQIGQYVRCPVVREENDELFPRTFALGQIREINNLSGEVSVTFHDLLDRARFYDDIFQKKTFPFEKVQPCKAAIDAPVRTPDGRGKILARKHDPKSSLWEYYILLQNGEVFPYLENSLEIDSSAADFWPIEQMKQYEFQKPTWYANRIHVSRDVHKISNSVYGFKELAGCRVFLMEHQLTTIVRALESRPVRYMLADEVGLGKTIEAASIIKILSSEKRHLRVLYIVPGALVHQWANELKYKFGISASIGDAKAAYSSHLIMALEDLYITSEALKENWDFLLVDETHRLLAQEDKYEIILRLSKNIENVLFLSATPIQDRKEEYFRLLTLLSPGHYCRLTIDDFKLIIKKQKKIQHSVNALMRYMNEYNERRDQICEKLDNLAEELNDGHLSKMVSGISSDGGSNGEKSAELAISYIAENYRVERNVIRNRRNSVHETFAIRKLFEEAYEVKNSDDCYSERNVYLALLDYLSWKISEDEIKTKDVFLLLQAMFSSPWALYDTVERLGIEEDDLIDQINLWVKQADNELNNADYFLNDAPDEIKSRILHVVEFIEDNVTTTDSSNGKVVIFSEFPQTLWKLGEVLEKRHIESVLFTANMQQSELEDSVYKFQKDKSSDCLVILCDETGGEGRNFQNADWIIHVDLPWNANAIEQRIGRLDRLGRDQDHLEVKSVVFYGRDTIESQLFRIWNEGLDLFQQSISGLEIITAELNEKIADAIRDDVYNGLENAVPEIKELTDDVRDTVEDEQLYDSASIIYKPTSDAVRNMLGAFTGEDDGTFKSSMLGWARQVGLKSEKNESGILQFSASMFNKRAAVESFYMPPDWEKYRNTPINRREGKILGTFDRSLAIKREDLIFYAPGDPVFDSIISNAINSERGRCTAFRSFAPFNYCGFAFIYNVEPETSYLYDRHIPRQILSQFRIYLPIEQITVYVPFPGSDNISDEELTRYIFKKKNIFSAEYIGRRSRGNDGFSPLEAFIEKNPKDEWEDNVEGAKSKALKKARIKVDELLDKDSAQKEIERIVNGYESEYIFLGKDTETLNKIKEQYKAVYDAISRPKLSLDSIALMFLTKR